MEIIKPSSKRITQAIDTLRKIAGGYSAPLYLVGDCVRNLLLGEWVEDLDVCIDQDFGATSFPDYLKKEWEIKCKVGSRIEFLLDTGKRGTWVKCEFLKAKGPKDTALMEDALGRDFCCDALYYDLKTGNLIDPTGRGLGDIKNLTLTTPIDPTLSFPKNPLSMLKAIRLGKKFELSQEIKDALTDYPEYRVLPLDQVSKEFIEIMSLKDPSLQIRELHRYRLLGHIIPELEESWGWDQNNHHHSLSLTDHMLRVMELVESKWNELLAEEMMTLRLAALLHDISKFRYHEVNRVGEFSFHGHEIKSSEMAEKILKRLGVEDQIIYRVKTLIRLHMIIKPFYNYETNHFQAKKGTVDRIIREIAKEEVDNSFSSQLFALIDGDNLAHHPDYNMPRQVDDFMDLYRMKKEDLEKIGESTVKIDGNRIMAEFGVSGREIGYIKDVMKTWVEEGEVLSVDEAFTEFRRRYIEPGEKIYVWNDMYLANRYRCSLKEPTKSTIGKTVYYRTSMYLDITSKELGDVVVGEDDLVVIEPKNNIKLYEKVKTHHFGRRIVKEIEDKMSELFSNQKFQGITICMDSMGDMCGKIEWDDFIDNVI